VLPDAAAPNIITMSLGGTMDGGQNSTDGEEFPLLVRLLQVAAERGEGTVLGLGPPGRARIGRVSRADAAAFAERLAVAYRERSPAMVRYATRTVGDAGRAEDVVQRAFEKILRRQRSDPPEITNMQAYVLTAVCNEINRELREVIPARANVSIDDQDTDGYGDAPRSSVDVSAQVTDTAMLREALAALSPREREAVVIRMQWQLSVAEAAEVMKLSTGAVKRYTSDGLRRLREHLDAASVA
jgi:RNA polymerase sigma factor (sigma-70 family)